MPKVQCSKCGTAFKSRFGNPDKPVCPACRAGDDRREPEAVGCGVCGDLPLEDREIRSLAGSTIEDVRACVLPSGSVVLHTEADSS